MELPFDDLTETAQYPYPPKEKDEKTDKEPFSVKWEELMGWFLIPKLGESLSWGMYDIPTLTAVILLRRIRLL